MELANANTIHALSRKEALIARSYDVKRYRQWRHDSVAIKYFTES